MSDVTIERAVKTYIRIRDEKDRLTREYNEKEAALKTQLEELESFFIIQAKAAGVTGFKTPYGTVFKEEKLTASCSDWDIFYNWIIEHKELDMLERRIKYATVKQFMADHGGELPPGVNVFREEKMRIRRT